MIIDLDFMETFFISWVYLSFPHGYYWASRDGSAGGCVRPAEGTIDWSRCAASAVKWVRVSQAGYLEMSAFILG